MMRKGQKMETEMISAEILSEESEAVVDTVNDPELPEEIYEEACENLPTTEETPKADSDKLDELLKHERIAKEYAEFSELFPGVSVSSLPDSVSESVRTGVPLAAAYALYHLKKEAAIAAASRINKKNSERSFALKKNDSSDSYFSPAEVREMSAAEVRTNYKKIIDSMSHWK